MQVHVHVVCTDSAWLDLAWFGLAWLGSARPDSTRVSFCVGWFVEVPAADRDRGNRGNWDRDWDLKCYMNVCTYVGAIGRWPDGSVRSLAGAYVRIQLAIHPPFVKERLDSHLFSPCRFICNLKRASIAQCVLPPPPRPSAHLSPQSINSCVFSPAVKVAAYLKK